MTFQSTSCQWTDIWFTKNQKHAKNQESSVCCSSLMNSMGTRHSKITIKYQEHSQRVLIDHLVYIRINGHVSGLLKI